MTKTRAALGQHFLKNNHYARILAESVHASVGDTILEIGPGKGILTRELLATGARVIAIERDPLLVHTLMMDILNPSLEVVEGDVREFDPTNYGLQAGSYALAANIPYYITGEIIRMFLTTDSQPHTMALLIQKEVARRIIDTKESLLSLSVKVYGTPKIIATVSRGNFSPPPQVDSAIIAITDISKKNFAHVSEEYFFKVLHAGFAAKRKMLAGNLRNIVSEEKILPALAAAGINAKARSEEVHVEQWLALTKALAQK